MTRRDILLLCESVRKLTQVPGNPPVNGSLEQVMAWLRPRVRFLLWHDFSQSKSRPYLGDHQIETFLRLGFTIPKRLDNLPNTARYVPEKVYRIMVQTVLVAIGVPVGQVCQIYNVPRERLLRRIHAHVDHMLNIHIAKNIRLDTMISRLLQEIQAFDKRRSAYVQNTKEIPD